MRDIVFDNVSRAFKRDGRDTLAVDNVSFEVPEREFVALVGPSGCGKTTCLRMAAGLEFSDRRFRAGGRKARAGKDGSDEAVMEIACPERTVTTTMKRENSKSVLADVKSTGPDLMNMKMRYTYVGPCRAGQGAFSYDKNSEQCKKIQASVAKMDPAKDCAGAGAQLAQCEQMMRQQIAQAKTMCN